MDAEYDCKFEEMKKYIPFLENMITRLESTNTSSSNPRQAQLDKIRSLRDLLSNKKKRMKMENLLKCEQVLVNLYAKVEQRDTLSSTKKETDSGFSIDAPTPKEKSDLEAVRNKLKTVVKRQENIQDTLPEILPRSEINDVHTSGTKEPALFQRRPNQPNQPNHTNQDTEKIKISPPGSASKRNYTRVLVSPERSSRRWSSSEAPVDKPLFSRRSPRKSPRRVSPPYYKKERKKSKDWQSRKQRDLNITLNVPEASLNSLNTKDILSRIINCSDGDVDIETLRELRKQILGELQKTGAKDDISDLILKSYNKNVNQSNKKKSTKKEEIEEGELSDSESEAIESIYGSLVVKEPGLAKISSENDSQPRKIQICLVINSDSKSEVKMNELPTQDSTDLAELEMYEDNKANKINADNETSINNDHKKTTKITKKDEKTTVALSNDKTDDDPTIPLSTDKTDLKNSQKVTKDDTANDIETVSTEEKALTSEKINSQFKANFYNPLTESSNSEDGDSKIKENVCAQVGTDSFPKTSTSDNMFQFESSVKKMEKSSEIPLLHDRTIEKQPSDNTLSEIDILQALKNEILSEISVPGTESTTPLLHQPKVIKVANAQANQVLPKKRISIEKYKEKSVTSSQSSLNKSSNKDDQVKKPSLKLTDKECERFFNVPKIPFDDEDESLEEDGDAAIETSDVYGDLAPKSPDNEDFSNIDSTPPVIIPVDPIKSVPSNYKADVDMRSLPLLSPNNTNTKTVYNNTSTNNNLVDKTKPDIKTDQNHGKNRSVLIDPRVRRDLNSKISTHSPNPHANNLERTSRQIYSGVPSGSTCNAKMTPNARTYEMTPTHQSFEIDQSNRKHVYASMSWETTDSIGDRKSRIDEGRESCWKPQTDDVAQNKRFSDSFNSDTYSNGPANNRYMDHRDDLYRSEGPVTSAFIRSDVIRKEGPMTPLPSFGRSDCPPTPLPSFGRSDCPPTPLSSFGRSDCPPTPLPSFGRSDCPPTPNHPFGRLECPMTPTHPFGRLECPSTPNHPFGRLDCPPTPSHPFGRLECPPTPNHPFGRLECPPTPSHSFGRMDCPSTPSHPFGRSECSPTPIHPFGRSEAPPPLMLGISECPNTSNNPFIGDGSTTPTPLFGRNEIGPSSGQTYSKSVSQTKHSYGRTDSLKNQFGRSDYNAATYIKDPRLNRKSDSESKLQYDERDQTYYKEKDRYRGASYSSQKSYNGSGSYRHRDLELSTGRNSKYKYFAPEQSGRNFNKDQDRRDRVVGRSQSKDHETCGAYGRERWFNSDHRLHEEVGSRRENICKKNTGRGSGYEETSSSEKPPSDNNSKDTLSVKSNTGRSFTIDTSINATFQQIIDSANEIQSFVSSFDMRRQRAGSVGRSLTREPSLGRVPTQVSKAHNDDNENKRRAFQRASSVGREVFDSKKDKRSLQEIKADFKSCRFFGDKFFDDKNSGTYNNKSKITTDSGHSNKDTYDKKKNESEHAKSSYSPRRNYRDPRMRKLASNKTDRHGSDNYGHKRGIVYSNDKIVSGSVLASGYGVKNYKIPKIKRITEEKVETLAKPDSRTKNSDKDKHFRKESDDKEKGLYKKKQDQKEKLKQDDITPENEKDKVTVKEVSKKISEKIVVSDSTEKRLTRSSKKTEEANLDTAVKSRKFKKLIYDSESDDDIETQSKDTNIKEKENTIKEKYIDKKGADSNRIGIDADEVIANKQVDDNKHEPKNKDMDPQIKEILSECEELYTESKSKDVKSKSQDTNMKNFDVPVKEKLSPGTTLSRVDHESNFGLDELEIFSDNVVSDPVIENITALIADLDNDLNTSKGESGHQFTKEITLENMMENISSPLKDRLMEMDEEDSAKILQHSKNKVSNNKIEESDTNENPTKEVPYENQIKSDAGFNHLESSHSEYDSLKEEFLAENLCMKNSAGNTPTQSDAGNNGVNKNNVDSTTETKETGRPHEDQSKLDENVDVCSTPDSTINTDDVLKLSNEESLQGSTNEVTSTESIELQPISAKEITPGLDSIGSLLSILQNKSKIKELLSMLGDQSSENEKIKKKLEKLSEIVSDDEESCDVPTTRIDQEVDKVESSEITDMNTIDCKEMEDTDVDQLSRDSSINNENSLKLEDDDTKTSDIEKEVQCKSKDISNVEAKSKKKPVKKTKYVKKAKGKAKKDTVVTVKRITRAAAAETKPKVKKLPRELMQLQEDIKEMFIRDEVLSATGIRMCRLAKLVDEKISPSKDEQFVSEGGPIVVLEKYKDTPNKNFDAQKNKKKKIVTKVKIKNDSVPETITEDKAPITFKHKPGPKSKTKYKKNSDPYVFESDLVCDTIPEKVSEDGSSSNTDSESDSLTSCKSFSSTELLSDLKKKTKRKRRGWQAGVIKTKTKKKKELPKKPDPTPDDGNENIHSEVAVPDLSCYTDRNYCFQKNQFSYSCRLCSFTGTDIVLHYRNQHPHTEIPLSRMSPEVANEAIEQCVEINFPAVSKITSDKYVCTFCFKEFSYSKSVLETFFWHIVSMHTGEYKQNCSECVNIHECPFNLDIPPPPKDTKGQLIGFICKKCNFTQISLENLKTHVIKRHNDEQTAVYTINMSVMNKKSLISLIRRSAHDEMLQPRNRTSDQVFADINEKCKDSVEIDESEGVKTRTSARKSNALITPPIQSKITFEGDDNISEASDLVSEPSEMSIKLEKIDSESADVISNHEENLATDKLSNIEDQLTNQPLECSELQPSSDIINCSHFKINVTESGAKEYLCCVNDSYHFKTTLLISMKKHVQTKHSENWDGFCYVCKVIVTPQGTHRFSDCLQHYLDKHMDNFPVLEKIITEPVSENLSVKKSYINVRPISELITKSEDDTRIPENASLPIIQSVRSLGSIDVETPQLNPTFPAVMRKKQEENKTYRYEEHQIEIVSKKYYLVLEPMMATNNLVKLFKCSGRYCLYATDSSEEALAHATTHQRIGGVDALNCCYCDFDSAGNAVDLVMHVFKTHGNCHYCCRQCFYRAASSQAVGAHVSRVHGVSLVPGSVLRTTTVPTIQTNFKMLTREEAVSYYICGHKDNGDSCKFRAYTPDKFCDHLLQRHTTASAHPCHSCDADIATPTDLIQHMKSHGLKLYQCTWCVHGADNENEMLTHVSIDHPNKQPQAYIRIITNKDGSNALRVLPLAFLTKQKVEAKDVTPSATKEHPVREAERSIEMEALIGPFMNEPIQQSAYQTNETPLNTSETPIHTSEIPEELIESSQDTKPVLNVNASKQNEETISQVIQPSNPTSIVTASSPTDIVAPSSSVTATLLPSLTVSPTVAVTPLVAPPVISLSLMGSHDHDTTPVTINTVTAPSLIPSDTQLNLLKPEPIDTEKLVSTDVVVLDSDEEDTSAANQASVIDLSDDEASTSSKQETSKIIPNANLYTCPQCKQICKSMGGFKKHIYSCVTDFSRSFQCPHCKYNAESLEKITLHYVADHTQNSTFECGLCRILLVSENSAKKHMRSVHKESNIKFTRVEKARFIVSVKEPQKEKVLPKRKLSGPKTDPIPAKRRFEPQEIDQLPISPILDQLVYCSRCEFSTKVRLNMVRHLQLHAEQQPVPQTAPVNPVPHLESNEKHFDKMLNLASSSIVNRILDKSRAEHTPSVTLLIPPEAASRYPKYVPERQRHTCGAKGCSYISVDEAMLRRHWDALHSGTSDFHCVHCPPHQHLDTSKPLTATRIVSHLKMHDSTLYACSSCSYYHFKREALEKHLSEIHKTGRLMVVREKNSAPVAPAPVLNNAAPTMDLKPWQCGLCKFKSMLRPEVVDHCSKFHQSKMQFKCAYCPFRTSAIENVTKHQSNSHAGKSQEVFYYYYREGSIPDDTDGTPRWMKQRQKAGSSEPEVKVESSESPPPKAITATETTSLTVDLNLVKKEANEAAEAGLTDMHVLCQQFGQFCEPNGIKYKCPLCSVVMEDTRELMQSHLFEELNYRKWSCGLCSYKGFHKAGLTDHMLSEHRRQYDHIELPTDINIERWVNSMLDHQASIIMKYKDNLAKQSIIVEHNKPGPSVEIVLPKENVGKYSDKDLETTFGSFGSPNGLMFCCPKCSFVSKDEVPMRDHLEMELNKIRWCCTNCTEHFQTYHEAQFHCKGHDGPSRPIEALRDPAMRATWVSTTIQKQKQGIQEIPTASVSPTPEKLLSENDNSLLVVRYEEKVSTPDQGHLKRKRTAPDSDDEKLVIDELPTKKRVEKHCLHCDYKSVNYNNVKVHMLTHFGLKPYACSYCYFTSSTKKCVTKHIEQTHPNKPFKVKATDLPPEAKIPITRKTLICLVCEKPISESDTHTHLHNNVKPEFSGSAFVYKCSICSKLCLDSTSLMEHNNKAHPGEPVKDVLYKLGVDTTEIYKCVYCDTKFKYIKEYRAHHMAAHPTLPSKMNLSSPMGMSEIKESDVVPSAPKRCARKSTTKLPNSVAKKSTTKLPNTVQNVFYNCYSYYGTKAPPLQQYANITTLMSFCNRMVPFSLKQLSEHINIEPKVMVTDIKDSSDYNKLTM
ncbi:unnamed protein product [Arctia plantaginis]|uniref:C2H2-type domain-containing protein n=1 Tax=Arctia plantaginis TaxID=874455 RepID=A0A8S0YM83_ARCPL|nr:unnamed protein product [Arctia plantaginis]